MALSNDLISQFVKVTQDKEETNKETTAYGKIVVRDDKEYVQLDGSELLTPISSTTVVQDGDRVMVTIKNHTAIVTGDFTNPSASNKDVTEIGNQISEFEIIIADKVSTKQLEAEIAKIDKLITDEITATNAKVETIEGQVAEFDTIKATILEVEEKVTANEAEFNTLRADIADFKDVTAERVDAIEGNFHTLESDYADFEETVTNKLSANEAVINKLQTDKLDAKTAEITYANIDFSNIKQAAIEKVFSDSGIIKDLIMSDGKVTGELVGVTIKGDLIEGNTLKADKLVILGEDGLYYKLNVDALGETTAKSDPKYQNGLDGSAIIAESITAEKIAVDDLVAFGATIGGYHINNHALYSGTKNSISNTTRGVYLGDDGQLNIGDQNNFLKYYVDENGKYKLEIQADTFRFGANNTTIEEYIDDLDIDLVQEPITKNTEGTELVIDDGTGIAEFIIEGKSEQATRSGKNKVNASLDETVIKGLTRSADLGRIYLNGTATGEDKFLFGSTTLAPGTYTMCMELKSGTTVAIGFYTYVGTSWAHLGGLMLNSGNGFKNSVTFTINEETIITPGVYAGTNNIFDNAVFAYQIVSGSDADYDFEPYGVMPSPDYPSEIKSVGYENLYDKDTMSLLCGLWHNNNTNKITTTSLGNYVVVPITGGKTYTVSRKHTTGCIYLATTNGVPVSGSDIIDKNMPSKGEGLTSLSIETSVEATHLFISLYGGTPTDEQKTEVIEELQIEEGTVLHPYIPYGKTGVEVISTGKNLFDKNDGIVFGKYINNAGLIGNDDGLFYQEKYINVKPNIIYTISALDNDHFRVCEYKSDYSFIQRIVGNGNTKTYTFITSSTTKFIRISCYNSNLNSIQLEESDTKTNYEPYFYNSTVIELDEPLRSLPNGVKDVVYIQNGKLRVERNVGSIVVNGVENWQLHYDNNVATTRRFALQLSTIPLTNIKDGLRYCSHFRGENGSNTNPWGYFYMSTSWLVVNDNTNTIASVDEFKTWLSTHNTEVTYELATPTTEEYDILINLPIEESKTNVYYVNNQPVPHIYCTYYTEYGKAIADLENNVNDTINKNTENFNQVLIDQRTQILFDTEAIILNATSEYLKTGDFDAYKETITGQLKVMSDTISLNFKKNSNDISDLQKTTNDEFATIKKYFDFSADGLTIGSGESAIKLTIDNDEGIIFTKNGEQFGYWDGNDFYTGNIVVRTNERAQFGAYAYIPRSDKSLMFLKVK